MDMKRILEKLDQTTAKPAVTDSNDMKKFVNIVTEAASPHKVALPVQMVMQHYNENKTSTEPSVLRTYFQEAQDQVTAAAVNRTAHLKMYAQQLAQRVMENRRYRDAYQRDYDSSVSGMGKRDSYAYSQDGGANDESNHLDPSDWYVVQDGKMMRVSVYPHQEDQARAKGYSPTREQARAKAQ